MANAQKAQTSEQVARLARVARLSKQDCYALRKALDSRPPTAESNELREALSDRLRELSAVAARVLLKDFGL